MCDKFIDSNGETIALLEEQVKNISHVITNFGSEALRTLCLAVKDMNENQWKEEREQAECLKKIYCRSAQKWGNSSKEKTS